MCANGHSDRASRSIECVLLDSLRAKIRDEDAVLNRAIYMALGVRRGGTRDVPRLWVEQTEGAKFWPCVVNDLEPRGVQNVLNVSRRLRARPAGSRARAG